MTDYRTHPQYLALLQSVLAAPCDDLPREVLADWLEEHGQGELAEFINVQCKLARLPAECDRMFCDGSLVVCPDCRLAKTLRRREMELFNGRAVREAFGDFMGLVHRLGRSTSSQVRLSDDDHYPANYLLGTVRRGFVAEVRCTLADWCGGECENCGGTGRVDGNRYEQSEPCPDCGGEYGPSDEDNPTGICSGTGRTSGIGPRLVREHPVERVVVVDRVAANIDRPMKFAWHTATEWRNVPHHIPPAVWSNLKGGERCANCPYCWGYPTLDDAESALSAALIAWAKGQPCSRA